MMGFWHPQTGTIRLGGENITELSERNIADFFSMVQQEVFLFNTTIRDNIRIGRPTATQKRMLLKDSPIIILDEATAALDGENEKLIQEALDELQRNKTVITIAHRLNTIQDMERIVVMDKGQVVSKGTHQELMKDCSLYRNMTETQEQVSKWQLKEEEE